jgi:2-polyprenyl-3-methyl-5-hydroxy-6-metoxy-1,4-benzoquinol methylase
MEPDYFVNHARAARFHWSLYHRPLETSLTGFLSDLARAGGTKRVLVIGAGFLHELAALPTNLRLTAVDVDDRVTRHLSGVRDPRLASCITVRDASELAAMGPFDAVYAKEVIEHVIGPSDWLRKVICALGPSGRLWLSTPNYGDPWLPLLEATFLEIIGRFSGYSRRDVHPTKFSAQRLTALLREVGLDDVVVQKTPFRFALIGTGRKTVDAAAPG